MSARAAEPEVVVAPNPGPQSDAYASTSDITVYGGGAGSGKSHLGLLRFGVHADRYPGYEGAIFRREMPMITQAGGLWEESVKMYPMFGARPNFSEHYWRWKRQDAFGSLVQFRSLQHEKDKLNFQGAQLCEFLLDEGTHFEESQFWYLFSRLRSTNAPTFKPRCLITCNPDPDSWLRGLVDWYIGEDGYPIRERAGKRRWFARLGDELVWADSKEAVRAVAGDAKTPRSFRFIPALLSDNPKGDPNYAANLEALPLVERERLLGGNWNVRHAAGLVFRRDWFEVIDEVPRDVVSVGRYWDLAATPVTPQSQDPDWTRGVKISKHASGMFVVHDVASLRGTPAEVESLIMSTAQQDGRACKIGFWQDPGQAGKSEAHRYIRMLAGYAVSATPAALDKVTYARSTSSQAEKGYVKLLRGPWNDAYIAEHQSFPDGKHDDIVDAESLGMLKMTTEVQVRTGNARELMRRHF